MVGSILVSGFRFLQIGFWIWALSMGCPVAGSAEKFIPRASLLLSSTALSFTYRHPSPSAAIRRHPPLTLRVFPHRNECVERRRGRACEEASKTPEDEEDGLTLALATLVGSVIWPRTGLRRAPFQHLQGFPQVRT